MAKKKIQETVLIDPSEIVVHHDLRGRKVKPKKEEIKLLAKTIADEGQLQPVGLRELSDEEKKDHEGKKYITVFGSSRCEAIQYHNEQEGVKPLKVEARIYDGSQFDLFLMTVHENLDRRDTTPVDDAFNQQRMRELNPDIKDIQIAKIYGCSAAWVSSLKKLLESSAKVQAAVAQGVLSPSAAIEVSSLKKKDQDKALEKAQEKFGSEKLSRDQIRRVAHTVDSDSSSSEGGVNSPVRKKMRSNKEIFEVFKDATTVEDDAAFAELCVAFTEFIKRIRSKDRLFQALDEFRGSEIYPVEYEDDGAVLDEEAS